MPLRYDGCRYRGSLMDQATTALIGWAALSLLALILTTLYWVLVIRAGVKAGVRAALRERDNERAAAREQRN